MAGDVPARDHLDPPEDHRDPPELDLDAVRNHAARRLRAEFRQRQVAGYVRQLELAGWLTTSAVEAIVANRELNVSARYVFAAIAKHRAWIEQRYRLQQVLSARRGIKRWRKLPKKLRKNAKKLRCSTL